MINTIKAKLKDKPNIKLFLHSPLNWIRSAYLTLKYVDKWQQFPAIQINGTVRIRIKKATDASLIVKGKLIFEQWLNNDGLITITIGNNATCILANDFIVGNGVKIHIEPAAKLLIKGKITESASGITADSIIMVKKYLEIGADCIIAWNTFLTDCDWHGIDGKSAVKETIIGDHVWIGVGAKILKGAVIGKNSIVPSLSVVLSGVYPPQVLLSGNPAKVTKTEIPHWHRDMFADRD